MPKPRQPQSTPKSPPTPETHEPPRLETAEEAAGLDPLGLSLRDHFTEYQGELLEQGYRVADPGYDGALPVRQAVDANAWFASKSLTAVKAIRCGEYAELGASDLRAFLQRRYGDEADRFIVDCVGVGLVRDPSWNGKASGFLDVVAPRRHLATRVITPDGRRFVLDYWEAGRNSANQMVTEKQWVERWRERLGDDMRYLGSEENLTDEDVLVQRVAFYEKRGATSGQALDAYRQVEEEKIRNAPGDEATRARRLKQLETRIRTFTRCGAFRSPTA